MNFDLTDDEKLIRYTAREFAEKEIKPIASKIDEEHRIPDEIIAKMGELGLLGTYVPEEYGGAGTSFLAYILVVEEISKACASSGVLISAHTSLCINPILAFGTEEQKKKYLPKLCSGEKIGCILLTEPEAGSDAANIQTTVEEDADHYIINGNKIFVTNGGFRGIGILFATYDKSLKHKGICSFIVDLSQEGVEILRNEEKLGIRGTYTTAFLLNNLKIPKENLLGKKGEGFKVAMDTLDGGRVGIAAQALGIAEGAFDRAIAYSQERKQFGKPISSFQAIQFKLADMKMRIEQARWVTYYAGWLKDTKRNFILESSIAKAVASETATFVTKEALQIFGGYGYITEYEMERYYRDAKITEIYEGTNEIQRIVISKMLMK
ncbi:acyl-CoA dehydrogenase [Deferribacter abyssi]|uniref:acyl-CoA dehydrogenase n=1 Tax=Deferribacter abyssi TaxID=213806 RepID=UPI003C210586